MRLNSGRFSSFISRRSLEYFVSRNSIFLSQCSSKVVLRLNLPLISFFKTSRIKKNVDWRHFVSWICIGQSRWSNADFTFQLKAEISFFRWLHITELFEEIVRLGYLLWMFPIVQEDDMYENSPRMFQTFHDYAISVNLRPRWKNGHLYSRTCVSAYSQIIGTWTCL